MTGPLASRAQSLLAAWDAVTEAHAAAALAKATPQVAAVDALEPTTRAAAALVDELAPVLPDHVTGWFGLGRGHVVTRADGFASLNTSDAWRTQVETDQLRGDRRRWVDLLAVAAAVDHAGGVDAVRGAGGLAVVPGAGRVVAATQLRDAARQATLAIDDAHAAGAAAAAVPTGEVVAHTVAVYGPVSSALARLDHAAGSLVLTDPQLAGAGNHIRALEREADTTGRIDVPRLESWRDAVAARAASGEASVPSGWFSRGSVAPLAAARKLLASDHAVPTGAAGLLDESAVLLRGAAESDRYGRLLSTADGMRTRAPDTDERDAMVAATTARLRAALDVPGMGGDATSSVQRALEVLARRATASWDGQLPGIGADEAVGPAREHVLLARRALDGDVRSVEAAGAQRDDLVARMMAAVTAHAQAPAGRRSADLLSPVTDRADRALTAGLTAFLDAPAAVHLPDAAFDALARQSHHTLGVFDAGELTSLADTIAGVDLHAPRTATSHALLDRIDRVGEIAARREQQQAAMLGPDGPARAAAEQAFVDDVRHLTSEAWATVPSADYDTYDARVGKLYVAARAELVARAEVVADVPDLAANVVPTAVLDALPPSLATSWDWITPSDRGPAGLRAIEASTEAIALDRLGATGDSAAGTALASVRAAGAQIRAQLQALPGAMPTDRAGREATLLALATVVRDAAGQLETWHTYPTAGVHLDVVDALRSADALLAGSPLTTTAREVHRLHVGFGSASPALAIAADEDWRVAALRRIATTLEQVGRSGDLLDRIAAVQAATASAVGSGTIAEAAAALDAATPAERRATLDAFVREGRELLGTIRTQEADRHSSGAAKHLAADLLVAARQGLSARLQVAGASASAGGGLAGPWARTADDAEAVLDELAVANDIGGGSRSGRSAARGRLAQLAELETLAPQLQAEWSSPGAAAAVPGTRAAVPALRELAESYGRLPTPARARLLDAITTPLAAGARDGLHAAQLAGPAVDPATVADLRDLAQRATRAADRAHLRTPVDGDVTADLSTRTDAFVAARAAAALAPTVDPFAATTAHAARAIDEFGKGMAIGADQFRVTEALPYYRAGVDALTDAVATARDVVPTDQLAPTWSAVSEAAEQLRAAAAATPDERGRITESAYPKLGLFGRMKVQAAMLSTMVEQARADVAPDAI